MIKYFQRTESATDLKELNSFEQGSFIYISDPSEDEINIITEKFGLEDGLIVDALDPYEAPRMEIKDGTAYIFARVPEQKGSIRQTTTFPIMFVLHRECLMIVSKQDPKFLISIIEKHSEYFTTQRVFLFLHIFYEIENLYASLLNKINKRINYFSLNVGEFKDQDIVNFVSYEVLLNEFINALLPLRHVILNIITGKTIDLNPDEKDLIDDLNLNNEQLIERSKSNLTNIVNIRKAHEVISTNRLNRVMQVLTVSTVILALPTMITSFYGMNVRLPYDSNPGAYWGIIISIGLSVAVLLFILRRKKII